MHASPLTFALGRSRVIKRSTSRSWRFEAPPRQESAHLRKRATFAATSRGKNAVVRWYQVSGMDAALAASQRFTLCASALRMRPLIAPLPDH